MNWTEPEGPTEGISYYDHTICETPLGRMIIEWKSWKINPDYDLSVENYDSWLGAFCELEEAKEFAKQYLVKKHKELSEFLGVL